jgi:3-mercaptopyruvate sulfurtransferase SseA
MALQEDGTFKPVEELQALYTGKGVTPDKEVISYCVFRRYGRWGKPSSTSGLPTAPV